MKKLTLILLCFVLALSMFSCSKENEEIDTVNRPPAFSVIQKQLKLTKHSEKSQSAAFSKTEFSDLLGEDLTYITVTSLPEAEKGVLVFNGQSVMKGQNLPAEQLEFLKFVPNNETVEVTFNFTCDGKSYGGNEMVCEIVFTDGVNSPPVAADGKIETVSGISCESLLEITEPNGDDYTINVITYPSDGYITLSSDGKIVYTPREGFSGEDKMVFSVTDRFGQESETATLSISVAENESGIYFADMQEDMNHLYAHKMCENNVMVYRYSDGQYYFDPAAQVSKMDFLVMMMNVAELDADITAVADSVVYDDSGLSSGLKGYLTSASEKGILKLENGMFSPADGITVADAAFMVANALKLPSSGSVSASTDNTLAPLSAVVNAGIIELVDGAVDPGAVLTKSDAAKLLYRIESYMIANNMKTNYLNREND